MCRALKTRRSSTFSIPIFHKFSPGLARHFAGTKKKRDLPPNYIRLARDSLNQNLCLTFLIFSLSLSHSLLNSDSHRRLFLGDPFRAFFRIICHRIHRRSSARPLASPLATAKIGTDKNGSSAPLFEALQELSPSLIQTYIDFLLFCYPTKSS